jgi:hypothetical protein
MLRSVFVHLILQNNNWGEYCTTGIHFHSMNGPKPSCPGFAWFHHPGHSTFSDLVAGGGAIDPSDRWDNGTISGMTDAQSAVGLTQLSLGRTQPRFHAVDSLSLSRVLCR